MHLEAEKHMTVGFKRFNLPLTNDEFHFFTQKWTQFTSKHHTRRRESRLPVTNDGAATISWCREQSKANAQCFRSVSAVNALRWEIRPRIYGLSRCHFLGVSITKSQQEQLLCRGTPLSGQQFRIGATPTPKLPPLLLPSQASSA